MEDRTLFNVALFFMILGALAFCGALIGLYLTRPKPMDQATLKREQETERKRREVELFRRRAEQLDPLDFDEVGRGPGPLR